MASSSFIFSALLAAAVSAAPAAKPKTAVLFLGDSVTIGLGVDDSETFPAVIAKRWKKEGLPWTQRVFAPIGGETSDIKDSLEYSLSDGDIALVVVEIGFNDGFQHRPPAKVRANLEAIVGRLKSAGIPALLIQMRVDPAKGAAYASDFDRIYPAVAKEFGVPLAPFPMSGIYQNPKLTIDRMHPNVEGHKLLAERLYPEVTKTLKALSPAAK